MIHGSTGIPSRYQVRISAYRVLSEFCPCAGLLPPGATGGILVYSPEDGSVHIFTMTKSLSSRTLLMIDDLWSDFFSEIFFLLFIRYIPQVRYDTMLYASVRGTGILEYRL